MTLRMYFAKALQTVRKHRDLTQEDFSDVSSRTYLSSLERGMKSPTLEKVEQLATVLNIHPVTLIGLAYLMKEGMTVDELVNRLKSEIRSIDR
jgi:transcriptional regulator with XRE-family HTH domain